MNIDTVLSALADPTRRRIVARLAQGPATTGQLAELAPISRPAVSQHLRLLHTAEVIHTTLIGRHRWHELSPDALLAVSHWAGDVLARHAKAPTLRLKETDASAGELPRTQHA